MRPTCLHDKEEIERFLRRNVDLHFYSIGDLDDFFWPYTTWYGALTAAAVEAIALLYVGQPLPTLLALSDRTDRMGDLLASIVHLLPQRFYAHLSPGLDSFFAQTHHLVAQGRHLKMALRGSAAVDAYDCHDVCRLGSDDVDEVVTFYQRSYPGNWFDPRMLESNQYSGIRDDGLLVSVAGTHVYSPAYRVAALGNVATAPSHRNRGYARQVTARTCQSLLSESDHIGLNVKADNAAAISCYRALGFEIAASYDEHMIERR